MPTRKKRTNPKVGCEFEREFKSKIYKLRVIEIDGRIAYKLGGVVFPSPSAAAKSITKTEVNGWVFWRID